MKPNLYNTIALRNPSEAAQLVKSEGYDVPKNDYKKLENALADIVNKQKESGLEKLASVHPDKDLFHRETTKCPEYKNADAATTTEKKFVLSENTINIILASSAAVIIFTTLAIVIRKIK